LISSNWIDLGIESSTEVGKEGLIDEGVVITIGSGGQPVDPDSLAVEFAEEVAQETGSTVIVSSTDGSREDGRPIKVNPPAFLSEN